MDFVKIYAALGIFGIFISLLILSACIILASRYRSINAVLMIIGQGMIILMLVSYQIIPHIQSIMEIEDTRQTYVFMNILSQFGSLIFGLGLLLFALNINNSSQKR